MIISSVNFPNFLTGPPSPPLLRLSADWITETEDSNTFNITVHWNLPLTGSISDNESFISGYVVTVRPQVLPCDDGSCVLTPGMREFVQRELTFSMRIGQTYNVTIRTENCNNSQPGGDSSSYFITLQGELHTLVQKLTYTGHWSFLLSARGLIIIFFIMLVFAVTLYALSVNPFVTL